MRLPISEIFHSIQGEGVFTGTPMMFVRLAGCNVGVYAAASDKHSFCTTKFGSAFKCDTDYHRYEWVELEALVDQCYEEHVCITGGEPLLHINSGLKELIKALPAASHIETSGTLPLNELTQCWITCSPKVGYLAGNDEFVDEWKLLVDVETQLEDLEEFVEQHADEGLGQQIYVQPVNNVDTYIEDSIGRCMEFLKVHPEWKLSAQIHKALTQR